MPASATSDETSGFLSDIFPGRGTFPAAAVADHLPPIRSRLCELVWLEPALFHLHPTGTVTLLLEEHYPLITARLKRPVTPGCLGEQIVIRGIDPGNLTVHSTVKIGDAILIITKAPDPTSPLHPACTLRFLEEGMAEPGAAVLVKKPTFLPN